MTRPRAYRRWESPRKAGRCRQGAALLVCVFVVGITTVIVVSMLDTMTLHMTAQRHTLQYQQAWYLAHAGVHHALSYLDEESTWREGIPSTEFPAGSGNTYSATVVDGQNGIVIVTGIGVAGGATRKLSTTVIFE